MAEETLLTDDFLRQLINVGEVDILVGLPTYNNAATIEPVLHAIQGGILKCFPRERAVIINVDGGSHDGTPQLVTGASIDDIWSASKVYALRTLHAITTQYAPNPEPGLALRTFCRRRSAPGQSVCSDLAGFHHHRSLIGCNASHSQSIKTISTSSRPPIGAKNSRRLMRNLLYPMIRAIYGYGIREPYATEFALSSRLATDFLNNEDWNDERSRNGAEILLTVTALTGQYRVCQSFLGAKPAQDRSATDLVESHAITVGSLFFSLDRDYERWSGLSGCQPVPSIGPESELTLEPVTVDRPSLKEMFSTGIAELEPVFRSILSLRRSPNCKESRLSNSVLFVIPRKSGRKLFSNSQLPITKLSSTGTTLFRPWFPFIAGEPWRFYWKTRTPPATTLEKNVESLCGEFERLKPYLLEIWADRK